MKAGGLNINTDWKRNMSYAIVGFGAEGQALARAFARKNMEVAVASRRSPEALLSLAKTIGPTVRPVSLRDAMNAEIILLAVQGGPALWLPVLRST